MEYMVHTLWVSQFVHTKGHVLHNSLYYSIGTPSHNYLDDAFLVGQYLINQCVYGLFSLLSENNNYPMGLYIAKAA